MNPYHDIPDVQFWSHQVEGKAATAIDYDPAPKWKFDIASNKFATAGSCFAQHFQRQIRMRGGLYASSERPHPLISADLDLGYDLFSARYGNIYTCRQFRELIEQALGRRAPIFDFFPAKSDEWIDLLRPRAVPGGFSCEEAARADRIYHLNRVAALLRAVDVFVFTLGLTEAWINAKAGHTYAICPGVINGAFDPRKHVFKNFDVIECITDLQATCKMIHQINPKIRILLTVSPVMLVASYEGRGALQSSIASKAILRATADICARSFDFVDYFPSFEIVTGPQSAGRFYKFDCREVSSEGVDQVMQVFFRSRFLTVPQLIADAAPMQNSASSEASSDNALFETECDEILLGRAHS